MKYLFLIAFLFGAWQGFSQDTTDVEKPMDSLQVVPTDSLPPDSLNQTEILPPDSLATDSNAFRLATKAFYKDGDTSFLRKVKERLQYPAEARERKFQAKLIVKFVISKETTISEIQIVEGFEENTDSTFRVLIEDKVKAAIQEASEGGWTAARNNKNQPVAMRKTLPIIFRPYRLEEEQK